MTPEQLQQFNLYGCGSRCLIKLAERQGKPISKSDFIDRFTPQFWTTDPRTGITCTSYMFEIAHKLNLCHHVETTTDRNFVLQKIVAKEIRGLIVRTDRWRNQNGDFIENHHCRLHLGRYPNGNWQLWHPDPSGEEMEMEESPTETNLLMPHYVLFC
jgi:hypothetical protein